MASVVDPDMRSSSSDKRLKFLPFVRVSGHAQPQASVLEDGVTMAIGGFTLFALFMDGWRHNNMTGMDNFWALPHILLYAGLSTLGLWIAIVLLRHQKGGLRNLDWSAVPYGYGLAFVALPLSAFAGNADFQWHEAFGFENQIDSTYSPPHQLLFLGGTLLATIPASSAWRRRGTAMSLGTLLPALISVSTIVAMTMFVIHQSTPFYGAAAMTPAFQQDIASRADAYAPGSGVHHTEGLSPAVRRYGDEAFPYYFYSTHHTIGGLLLTSFMLFGGVLVMRRRWKLPFGSLTIMFGWMAWQLPLLSQYREWKLAVSLVIAGVIGDVLLATLVGNEGPIRVARVRIFATVMPVILWGVFLLILANLGDGLGWGPTLWTGILTTTAGFGYALSLLVFPPFEGTTAEQVPASSA